MSRYMLPAHMADWLDIASIRLFGCYKSLLTSIYPMNAHLTSLSDDEISRYLSDKTISTEYFEQLPQMPDFLEKRNFITGVVIHQDLGQTIELIYKALACFEFLPIRTRHDISSINNELQVGIQNILEGIYKDEVNEFGSYQNYINVIDDTLTKASQKYMGMPFPSNEINREYSVPYLTPRVLLSTIYWAFEILMFTAEDLCFESMGRYNYLVETHPSMDDNDRIKLAREYYIVQGHQIDINASPSPDRTRIIIHHSERNSDLEQ